MTLTRLEPSYVPENKNDHALFLLFNMQPQMIINIKCSSIMFNNVLLIYRLNKTYGEAKTTKLYI